MQHLLEFVGRFHPAIVHLPIGIFLLTILLAWWRSRSKVDISTAVLTTMYGIGALSAWVSVITGLALSRGGDYDLDTIQGHQWMAISLSAFSTAVWWALRSGFREAVVLKWGSLLLLAATLVTGHLGGSITHGPSYLTEPLRTWIDGEKEINFSKINLEEAKLYSDVIAPILEARCYSCHGPEKQKGKLRLDNPSRIVSGGKNGPVVDLKNPDDSEILTRLQLALDHEHHMPPKERKQLSREEVAWITLWIESGTDFEKPLIELTTREKINELVASRTEIASVDVPEEEMKAPDQQAINELLKEGVSVTPVAIGSPYLQVNFASVPHRTEELIRSLDPIAANIVWLKLSHSNLTDRGTAKFDKMKNLRRLNLDNTHVTDSSMAVIATLSSLVYLNLSGTEQTFQALQKLSALPKLRDLYLHGITITGPEEKQLEDLLKDTRLEWGGYEVPAIPSDTVVFKPRRG